MAAKAARKARILVVDDHPVVRQGLVQMLDAEPDLKVCAEASDPAEALKAASRTKPDLVLTDLSLGDRGGLELIKDLHARQPGVPILVLSMHDETFYAERALRAGAKGYIMKQEAAEKIAGAVRRVLKGEIHLSEKTAAQLLHSISLSGPKPGSSLVTRLSDRELEIFSLIGSGYGTSQIAEKLHLSAKTVETHRQHIKDKLKLDKGGELVRFAVQWFRSRGTP